MAGERMDDQCVEGWRARGAYQISRDRTAHLRFVPAGVRVPWSSTPRRERSAEPLWDGDVSPVKVATGSSSQVAQQALAEPAKDCCDSRYITRRVLPDTVQQVSSQARRRWKQVNLECRAVASSLYKTTQLVKVEEIVFEVLDRGERNQECCVSRDAITNFGCAGAKE